MSFFLEKIKESILTQFQWKKVENRSHKHRFWISKIIYIYISKSKTNITYL